MTVSKQMIQVDGHAPNCQHPSKARRLYIRNYNSVRKKQVFTPWGIVCKSCRMVVELKHAVIKGSKRNQNILNRRQKRRNDRIIQRFQKKLDREQNPAVKAMFQKKLDQLLKGLRPT
jgi:hypothetical protein